MAGRKLAASVLVDGTVYGPGSDVPAEAAKLIVNPKAWGSEPDAGTGPAKKSTPSKSEKK